MNPPRFISFSAISSVLLLATGQLAQAQPKEPTFWQDVRPILRKHCTVCHSAKNLKEPDVSGGLALDSYDATRKGTKHPIFEAGKADKSVIVQLLTTSDKAKRMPLDAPPLSKENIDLI